MKMKTENISVSNKESEPKPRSAIDLWRQMGGEPKRGVDGKQRSPNAMLATYKNRVTYTFLLDDEVASIHFDSNRGEIFFKGHNIGHLKLTEGQINALIEMKDVLAHDSKAHSLFSSYCATLGRYLTDNSSRGTATKAGKKEK